jgi:hypothetical protein
MSSSVTSSSEGVDLTSIVAELFREVQRLRQRLDEAENKSAKQAAELERLLGCVNCVE